MAPTPEIILYHYTYSPYARRVVWYLNLRGIPYTQCLQPPVMPRPDVAAIGTSYRRIPILAIGRDIYNDTRLILRKLEQLYPDATSISTYSPDQRAIQLLLESWTVDSLFARAALLIPVNLPAMNDAAFLKDRREYSGRPWAKDTMEKMRPEALVEVRSAFELLETTLLGDGRDWILKTDGPSLADIEAVWPFHWLESMKGALPANLISAEQYPKVFAWIHRFHSASRAAAAKAGKPKTVKGAEAARIMSASDFADSEGSVDSLDPHGLKKGEVVEVWPVDTGFSHKDRGALVALSGQEVVIESKTGDGKTVRVHAPRHGFRIKKAEGANAKL